MDGATKAKLQDLWIMALASSNRYKRRFASAILEAKKHYSLNIGLIL